MARAWAAGCGTFIGGMLLAGCTIVVPPPHPPHPPQGPPTTVAQGAVNGAPAAVKPNSGVGIHIWRTEDGKWHVLSAAEGKLHKFRGTIDGDSSAIGWYEPEWMELGDSMGRRERGLVFYFETGGHLDGFHFVPDDHGCVRFHVTVDERLQPDKIFLGSAGVHPPSEHFVACP